MYDERADDEPLSESLVLAWRWSREHCSAVAGKKDDCGWYHGFWQIARALGVSKTAGGHADFLFEALRSHARSGDFGRVLVCGTADYAMPALVYRAYGAERARADLTVLDWCETPLALTRWYADRAGRTVRTVCSDIRDHRAPGAYDLIVTNSLLGYFRPDERAVLFRAWAGWLRPGGKAVFTNRVRAQAGNDAVGFRPDEADRFCDEIASRAASRRLGIDAAVIDACVREYVRRFRVYPVGSQTEVQRDLEDAGFGAVALDLAPSRALTDGVSGPATTEQGTYVRIVATRAG